MSDDVIFNKNELDDRWGVCPMKDWCKHKDNVCTTKLPDRHCPLYQYFESLIEKHKKENPFRTQPIGYAYSVTINTKQGSYVVPMPRYVSVAFEPVNPYLGGPGGRQHFVIDGTCDNILVCGENLKV